MHVRAPLQEHQRMLQAAMRESWRVIWRVKRERGWSTGAWFLGDECFYEKRTSCFMLQEVFSTPSSRARPGPPIAFQLILLSLSILIQTWATSSRLEPPYNVSF